MTPILVDLSLESPEQNLALDEALLKECDNELRRGKEHGGFLRFWESSRHFVVLGISRPQNEDVDVGACDRLDIPILRRASGGGTVVQGPGCLNFAVILPMAESEFLADVQASYRWIVERSVASLGLDDGSMRGSSDLVLGNLKFGGSAQKRTPRAVLHHATLLYDFNLSVIPEVLPEPTKRPDYRGDRSHENFVRNLPLTASEIRERLTSLWSAVADPLWRPPDIAALVADKYARESWTRRF